MKFLITNGNFVPLWLLVPQPIDPINFSSFCCRTRSTCRSSCRIRFPVFHLGEPLRITHFQLADRALGERSVAVQIVCVEDRAHVAQAVPGDRRDLGLGQNCAVRPDAGDRSTSGTR
jgi:hypothetical protein